MQRPPREPPTTGRRATASPAPLAHAFVELADNLTDDFDVLETLQVLADRCVELLEVDAAALLHGAPHDPRVVVSSASARLLDLLEVDVDSPGTACLHSGEAIVDLSLAGAVERWPRFARAALASGFRTVTALPLRRVGRTIGSLTLFRADGAPTLPGLLDVGRALADVATISVLQHRAAVECRELTDQLDRALQSRVVIEQAKGVLAARGELDMDQAFAALRRHARRTNARLSDVARRVIDGPLPDELAPPHGGD